MIPLSLPVSLPGVYAPQDDTELLVRALGASLSPRGPGAGRRYRDGCRRPGGGAAGRLVTAVDISWRAVLNAKVNAVLARLPMTVVRGDLLGPVSGRSFDLILSNPPYVPGPEPARRSGPGQGPGAAPRPDRLSPARGAARAWDGGWDGRLVLDRICRESPALLRPGGVLLLVQSALSDAGADADASAGGGAAGRRRGSTAGSPSGPSCGRGATGCAERGLLRAETSGDGGSHDGIGRARREGRAGDHPCRKSPLNAAASPCSARARCWSRGRSRSRWRTVRPCRRTASAWPCAPVVAAGSTRGATPATGAVPSPRRPMPTTPAAPSRRPPEGTPKPCGPRSTSGRSSGRTGSGARRRRASTRRGREQRLRHGSRFGPDGSIVLGNVALGNVALGNVVLGNVVQWPASQPSERRDIRSAEGPWGLVAPRGGAAFQSRPAPLRTGPRPCPGDPVSRLESSGPHPRQPTRTHTPRQGAAHRRPTCTVRRHEARVLHPRCPRSPHRRRRTARRHARLSRRRVARPSRGAGASRDRGRRTGRGGRRVQGGGRGDPGARRVRAGRGAGRRRARTGRDPPTAGPGKGLGRPLRPCLPRRRPGRRPERQEADAIAARRLGTAAEDAADRGVRVLLETHDSHRTGADAIRVLGPVGHGSVGSLWDVMHTWLGGEQPAATYAALSPLPRLRPGQGHRLPRRHHPAPARRGRPPARRVRRTPLPQGLGRVAVLGVREAVVRGGRAAAGTAGGGPGTPRPAPQRRGVNPWPELEESSKTRQDIKLRPLSAGILTANQYRLTQSRSPVE